MRRYDPREKERAEVNAFASKVKRLLGLQRFDVGLARSNYIDTPDFLVLDSLVVPRAAQGQGAGSHAMQALVDFADYHGRLVALTPASPGDFDGAGTTSRARLIRFYKRFGFVENTGRKRDLTLSHSMFRLPRATVVR